MNYIWLLILSVLIVSCKPENRCDCFKSNANQITVTRNLPAFQELVISSVFDVEWICDSIYNVSVTCGEKLEQNIKTEIIESTLPGSDILEIENKNKCNWVRSQEKKIKIVVRSPSLSTIRILSPCDFLAKDTIKTEVLKVDDYAGVSKVEITADCYTLYFSVHAGNGLFTLHGKSAVAFYYGFGNCHLHFDNMVADYCYMTSNSTGQSYINVSKELGVTIKGRGNVYYKGNPYKVDKQEEGEGKLICVSP